MSHLFRLFLIQLFSYLFSYFKPEPVKQQPARPPIPAEHMELQQTFNAMIDKCRSAANNPVSFRIFSSTLFADGV